MGERKRHWKAERVRLGVIVPLLGGVPSGKGKSPTLREINCLFKEEIVKKKKRKRE